MFRCLIIRNIPSIIPISRVVSKTPRNLSHYSLRYIQSKMAPLTLTEQLEKLSINPSEKNIKTLTFPNENVVDFYRNLITDKLSKVSGIDYNVIYEALETVNSLE